MRSFASIAVLLIAGLFSVIPHELTAGVREDAEAVIRQFYPGATALHFQPLPLDPNTQSAAEQSAGQAFLLDKLFHWEIRADEAVLGYAVLDNVMGKAQPITYLVLFTPDLKVQSVRVIRYREQYGGAIQESRWLEQFRGRDRHSGFAPGRHIDGISGATISVNAISRGVKRITVYMSRHSNDAVAADTE
ncbi:MAG: FMN-binding protein [Candidatus Marinimicrobia bacterium]|nr:FMN-binding protein [Candidatus Neomarinimicrobiota bacterium]MCF7840558.1 FMN-binding protein [Candidatus Neomarinimicrobiota bacterium]